MMNSRSKFFVVLSAMVCALISSGGMQGDSPFDSLKRRSVYENEATQSDTALSPLDQFASFGMKEEDAGTVGHALFERLAARAPQIKEIDAEVAENDTDTSMELGQKLAQAFTQLAADDEPQAPEPTERAAQEEVVASAPQAPLPSAGAPAIQVDIQPEITDGTPEPTHQLPQEEPGSDKIYLNFENAELNNVVAYMANLRKINLIPDKGIAGSKISLTIRRPLSPDEAWRIFHTVLDRSGFSIVKVGIAYKVV